MNEKNKVITSAVIDMLKATLLSMQPKQADAIVGSAVKLLESMVNNDY